MWSFIDKAWTAELNCCDYVCMRPCVHINMQCVAAHVWLWLMSQANKDTQMFRK